MAKPYCKECNDTGWFAFSDGNAIPCPNCPFPVAPGDVVWTHTVETRFGPDYLCLSMLRTGSGPLAELIASETTDPLDGRQQTDIMLDRAGLLALRAGADAALAWMDEHENDYLEGGE